MLESDLNNQRFDSVKYDISDILRSLPVEFSEEIFSLLKEFEISKGFIKNISKQLNISYEDSLIYMIYFLFKKIIKLHKNGKNFEINNIFWDIFNSNILNVNFTKYNRKNHTLFSIFLKIRELTEKGFVEEDISNIYIFERQLLEIFLDRYFQQGYLIIFVNIDAFLDKLSSYYYIDNQYHIIKDKITYYEKKNTQLNEKIAFIKLKKQYEKLLLVDQFDDFFTQFYIFVQLINKISTGEYLDKKIEVQYLLKITGIDIKKIQKIFKINLKKLVDVIDESGISFEENDKLKESKYVLDILNGKINKNILGAKYKKFVFFDLEKYLSQRPNDGLYLFEKINIFLNILRNKNLLSK